MKRFPILQVRAYVVELPEGAHSPLIEGINVLCDLTYIDEWGYDYCSSFRLPPGPWQIVGLLPEVTEEQAAGIVDYNSDVGYYESYGAKTVHHKNGIYSQHAGFLDALESLESAILAEGYGFHSEPEPSYSDCEQYENPMRTYEGRLREWNSKQSRVLSRERCLLLMKVDG